MSRDPYLDVKRDVEQNLASTQSLLQSYNRINSSPGASSSKDATVREAHEELLATLEVLEGDLEDLDESVRVVEEMGDRWSIPADEVRNRRGFVERVKSEVRNIRNKVSPGRSKGKNKDSGIRYTDDPDSAERGGDEDVEEARRWEMEEQQTIMRRQDDTLGVISGALTNLASQAGLIGHEVGEQTEMLEDLSSAVDNTDSRLRKVSKTMRDFMRRNEETKSGYCICILIIVLIVLLVLVILT